MLMKSMDGKTGKHESKIETYSSIIFRDSHIIIINTKDLLVFPWPPAQQHTILLYHDLLKLAYFTVIISTAYMEWTCWYFPSSKSLSC